MFSGFWIFAFDKNSGLQYGRIGRGLMHLQVGKLGPSSREGSCQGLGSFLW